MPTHVLSSQLYNSLVEAQWAILVLNAEHPANPENNGRLVNWLRLVPVAPPGVSLCDSQFKV